jgi:hypothetical protein
MALEHDGKRRWAGRIVNGHEIVSAGPDRLPPNLASEIAKTLLQISTDPGLIEDGRGQVGTAHRIDRRKPDEVGE